MKAIEGAIYCQDCAGKLLRRTPSYLALSYPATHDGDKGICWGCDKEIQLRLASKVIDRRKG